MVRGKPAGEAYTILKFLPHAAARELEKVLWSAMHNLINHSESPVSEEEVQKFRISKIFADQGPTLRRIQPQVQVQMQQAQVVTMRAQQLLQETMTYNATTKSPELAQIIQSVQQPAK